MQNEKKLLNEVSEKLRNFEESQKKEGGIFNIFSITKIERREVDTHSAMIAELLNPRGRHGQDDKFLIQFLKTVIPECEFSETNSASVFKEKSFNSLGRVDILIILDDHVFVIENKIDAEDGEKQLERYKKILETYNNKKRHLIYLTIDGSEAEKYSLGSVKDNEYRRISYENHILNWLDSCIEISNTLPKLEYALRQYQDIIKKITGKSMTNNLKNELVELLLEEGNFESAQKISSVITLAK